MGILDTLHTTLRVYETQLISIVPIGVANVALMYNGGFSTSLDS